MPSRKAEGSPTKASRARSVYAPGIRETTSEWGGSHLVWSTSQRAAISRLWPHLWS